MIAEFEGHPECTFEHEAQELVRLLAYAQTLDPERIVAGSTRNAAPRIKPHDQANYINGLLYHTPEGAVLDPVQQRLASWLLCSQEVMRYIVQQTGRFDTDLALDIATHEHTADALAALVSHHEDAAAMMSRGPTRFYALADDATHIVATGAAKMINALADYPETVYEGQIHPSEVFCTYTDWSAEIAIRSLIPHQTIQPRRIVPGEAFGQTPLLAEDDSLSA